MTVNYNLSAVATNSCLAIFKIIFHWKGSLWKSVYKELLIWLVCYYFVFFIYRSPYILGEEGRSNFALLREHIKLRIDWIPLNILLGFFVSLVVDRWRQIFSNMGFIENAAHLIAVSVRNRDAKDVLLRRTLVRYLCLAQVLAFRDISLSVRKRFPNMDTLIKAGFLEEHEKYVYEGVKCSFNRYWIPISWAFSLTHRGYEQGQIPSENYEAGIMAEFRSFRTSLATLCNFDWVPIPLAYPQLVSFAVRAYFCCALISRQFVIGDVDGNRSPLDMYFPLMTVLQFLFYIGWVKIAESHLNPLGEEDDHFECNVLIDRNIQTGLAIVDDTCGVVPEMVPDRFGDDHFPLYTEETAPKDGSTYNAFAGSVAHIVFADDNESVEMIAVAPVEDTVQVDDDDTVFGQTIAHIPTPQKQSVTSRLARLNSVFRKMSGSGASRPGRIRRLSSMTTARRESGASPSSGGTPNRKQGRMRTTSENSGASRSEQTIAPTSPIRKELAAMRRVKQPSMCSTLEAVIEETRRASGNSKESTTSCPGEVAMASHALSLPTQEEKDERAMADEATSHASSEELRSRLEAIEKEHDNK